MYDQKCPHPMASAGKITRLKALTLAMSLLLLVAPGLTQEIKDIVYAITDSRPLKLDLYLPEKTKNAPIIMHMHGGGWKKGSKTSCTVKFLIEHGYAVASIEYRFSDEAIFPAQIHDCKAAVRFLKSQASKYGYNPKKMAVSGSSAGGQLAALLGSSHGVEPLEGEVGKHLKQNTRVQAVIDFFGCSDFILRGETQPKRANSKTGIVSKYLGGPVNEQPEQAKLASAVTHMDPNDPPYLIFHGKADTSVLPDQSERLHSVCKEHNVESTLVMLDGVGHSSKPFCSPENKKLMVKFLDKHLK
ncbi:MAG: alpha/beta hydrolase [Planctomycetes bacterium]|nr:alpha/beta hydrolase [Planctomycetota bacterium]